MLLAIYRHTGVYFELGEKELDRSVQRYCNCVITKLIRPVLEVMALSQSNNVRNRFTDEELRFIDDWMDEQNRYEKFHSRGEKTQIARDLSLVLVEKFGLTRSTQTIKNKIHTEDRHSMKLKESTKKKQVPVLVPVGVQLKQRKRESFSIITNLRTWKVSSKWTKIL